MLFKKNKIAKNIKESNKQEEVSGEFESLSSVSKNRKINKLKTKLNNEYHDGIENVKDKCHRTLTYTKTHWFLFFKLFLIALLISLVTLGSILLFNPFFANLPSSIPTPLNNFYIASNNGSGIVFSLTNAGIAFTVIFALVCAMSIFYFVWATIKKKIILKTNLTTKVLSVISYILIGIVVLMISICLFIRPTIPVLAEKGQQIYNNLSIVNDATSTQVQKEQAAQTICSILNIPFTNLDQFRDSLVNGTISLDSHFPSYSFVQNAKFYIPSTISTIGWVIIGITIGFLSIGMLILPATILIINMFEQYKLDNDISNDWGVVKLKTFNFLKATGNFFKKMFTTKWWSSKKDGKNEEDKKEKKSFRKYKKEMEHNKMYVDKDEQFSSEKIDNTVTNVISKEEIEKHEPNKAFLNNQGQWMYHDGKGKMFIVKNDEWVPYDPNASIHIAHVNVNSKKDTEMSQKVAKESKLKKNKIFDNLAQMSKKEALIDIPDEELDKIIKDLDI